ncbi:MAG: SulP family inorganic anion transporter [Alphaproteobacteria bacterium]
MPDGTATSHLLEPKLIAIFREGYGADTFRRDLIAAVTVAIVALPLSMAIAVASGVTPERGLFTAIVGGFVVSALSGSRFQIGGPAGAFIVLVAAAVTQFGTSGVLTAVLLSGVMLALLGVFRVGSLVRHIPHAVTVGFTAGIAATIAASQIKDLGGIALSTPEPAAFFPKLEILALNLPHINPWALGTGLLTSIIIFGLRAARPNWPGMLVAVAVAALITAFGHLPIETIASRFGGIPHGLPAPALPQLSVQGVTALLPTALSFTLLGAVESLLSAKVADGMTGRKHRSNMELVGQGIANIASALFGGICVTGTIARTATNIRAGGRTPVSGMLHSVFLLVFMLIAAPLAGYIPLSALAGVLLVVCWTMFEKKEFRDLLKTWPTAIVLLTTFGATLLKDLTWGIVLGCAIAFLLSLLRKRVPEEGG